MATAILIHGCHLQAEAWEHIVWGDPKHGVLGRVPKGLQLAEKHAASLIFWGTGASQKDGKKESEYTYDYALQHIHELDDVLKHGFAGYDAYEIQELLGKKSRLDLETQNTTDEIAAAAAFCKERRIDELILVSSPTHIARCLQEAQKLKTSGALEGIEVLACASDTCFKDSTPADVVIIEPPHRGDMPKVPFHKTVRRIFATMRKPEIAFKLNDAMNKTIDEHIAML